MSLVFSKKQLAISLLSARGPLQPTLVANKFSLPQPLTGPIPLILRAFFEVQSAPQSPDALPELAQALVHCVGGLVDDPSQPGSESRSQSAFERVCVYLQNHYQRDITRDSVAAHFGITPNHLSRLFHAHGHMTFINYLTHVRLAHAKHLLTHHHLKLEDVAARCGFRDAPYFCRVFKRFAQVTPAEYREAMLRQLRPTVSPSPGQDPVKTGRLPR